MLSRRSSSSVQHRKNRQLQKRNQRLNTKISIIIATDFLCWVPFIIICILHSTRVINATEWYAVFSIIILPINSVINPLLYDNYLGATLGRVSRSLTRTNCESSRQMYLRDSQNQRTSNASAGKESGHVTESKTTTSKIAESTM